MTADSTAANLWAVVLAGERGEEPQAARPQGPGRAGSASLLRQTLNRIRLAIAPERTVVVADRCQPSCLAEVPDGGVPRLVIQPQDRGTAAAVLLPVHWIRRQEPQAIVAIFPSDQVVLHPLAFMRHVVEVTRFVERHDREIVLVGAGPTYPDTRYGWIETAERIPDSGYEPVWRVSALRKGPSYSLARACCESGGLWNTSVIVARAEALLQASGRRLPELDARLETVAALVGTPYEERALEECYAVAPQASLFEAVLAGVPQRISASRLPPIHWSGRSSPSSVRGPLNPRKEKS